MLQRSEQSPGGRPLTDGAAHEAGQAWPPDYVSVYAWRQQQVLRLRKSPALIVGARAYYASRPVEFIEHWLDTVDPRNAGSGKLVRMPFVLFPKQREMVAFLLDCVKGEHSGLVEKSRDMGATWLCCAFSVWLWLFWPGAAIGWGSRKEQLVDRIGDMDSIFEKIRALIRSVPSMLLPHGFSAEAHATFMRIVNPQTGATITGEAGDNIGRGGRKLIFFKDESAHYERPEKIEAALADTTRTQIDISSVNGLGNVFHRRREGGVDWAPGVKPPVGRVSVIVMDWRDHPEKDDAWYAARRAKAAAEGLLHVFAQEVDRNYAAAVDGIIIPNEWVRSAIDAHLRLGFDGSGRWIAGLDVADGGSDLNALVRRKGPVVVSAETWGERDVGVTTRRAISACAGESYVAIEYDAVGVGAGVKSEANRLSDEGLLPRNIRLSPWNAAASSLAPDEHIVPGDPETPINKDFYANLKAQAWWQMRLRFERTHRAITEGLTFDPQELVSLPSDLTNLWQLVKELSQATVSRSSSLKLVVDKTPEGTKSPNLADAAVMAFWPADRTGYDPDLWSRLAS